MLGIRAPEPGDIENYSVNVPDQLRVIYEPLFDFTTYPQAGATSLTFFQNKVGQGGKTKEDTNMPGNGSLPAPQMFMCTGVSVEFFPAALPGRSGDIATNWNDVYEVFQTGLLRFSVGESQALRQGPLGSMPPCYRLGGAAALTGNPGTETVDVIDYASPAGKEFRITPVVIPTSQNFQVELAWDSAVDITEPDDARIGVRLYGFRYLAVQ